MLGYLVLLAMKCNTNAVDVMDKLVMVLWMVSKNFWSSQETFDFNHSRHNCWSVLSRRGKEKIIKGILRGGGGNLKHCFHGLYSCSCLNGNYPWLPTVSPHMHLPPPPLCCTVRCLPPPVSLTLLLCGSSRPAADQPCRGWDLLGGFLQQQAFCQPRELKTPSQISAM